jgi:hypothetical protein
MYRWASLRAARATPNAPDASQYRAAWRAHRRVRRSTAEVQGERRLLSRRGLNVHPSCNRLAGQRYKVSPRQAEINSRTPQLCPSKWPGRDQVIHPDAPCNSVVRLFLVSRRRARQQNGYSQYIQRVSFPKEPQVLPIEDAPNDSAIVAGVLFI